ncbi:MAG: ABC transporter substrate-binding protein [Muribaculaceae bacterium]|nr:ABC transporter substrate-binding protein [Muribaculaceae bacterium]
MKNFYYSFILLFTLVASSCGGNGDSNGNIIAGDTLTTRAELLTMVDCGDFVAAIVENPWKPGTDLAAYALVPKNSEGVTVPDGFIRVNVPVERSLVYSSTNMSAIRELGALEAVSAVADGNYYTPVDTVTKMINAGVLTDIGNSMSPKLETIIDVSPDAILVSPYENAGHGVIDALKVPVIECADYMETTPLGRAEWLLLLGELYGKRDEARHIYNNVVTEYESLRDKISTSASQRPKVLTEMLTSGVWYVPGGKSYMSSMLSDAGADYPWSDNASTGSLQLDAGAVLDKASDADIWVMRNYGNVTLPSLAAMSPLYSGIKAYKNGEVYNCDSSVSPIFNDIAFHPERVLADFASIFHPEIFPEFSRQYYHKVLSE